MRQCISGTGTDTTTAVQAYLAGTSNPLIRHLYMIGEQDNPGAIFLTDHEAPVIYPPWGTFYNSNVSRGSITTKIGLEIQSTTVAWTPANQMFTQSRATASPMQLARQHAYDNWPVRIWKCFMPTPGDCITLGACEWFGGRIGSVTIGRNQLQFEIKSFLDVVTQKVPANVIESTSSLASYTGATLPPGDPSIPVFQCFPGSTTNQIIADCTSPNAGKIYSGNLFVGGFMVFLSGAGATLGGAWSAISGNGRFADGNGNSHSSFALYQALDWAPTPGVDTFYVSKAAPINLQDGSYAGFDFVPDPTTAI